MRIESLRFTVARQSYISPVSFAFAVNMFHVGKEFFSFEGVKAAVEKYHTSSYCQYYIRSGQQKDSCNNNVYTDWPILDDSNAIFCIQYKNLQRRSKAKLTNFSAVWRNSGPPLLKFLQKL